MLAALSLGAFLNFGCGEDTDPLPEPEYNQQPQTCEAGYRLISNWKADGSASCVKIEQEPQEPPPPPPPPPPPCPEWHLKPCPNHQSIIKAYDSDLCTWSLTYTDRIETWMREQSTEQIAGYCGF